MLFPATRIDLRSVALGSDFSIGISAYYNCEFVEMDFVYAFLRFNIFILCTVRSSNSKAMVPTPGEQLSDRGSQICWAVTIKRSYSRFS